MKLLSLGQVGWQLGCQPVREGSGRRGGVANRNWTGNPPRLHRRQEKGARLASSTGVLLGCAPLILVAPRASTPCVERRRGHHCLHLGLLCTREQTAPGGPSGAGTTGVMTGAEAQGQGWEEGETAAKGNLTGVIISPDRRFLSVWGFLLDGQGLWIH